MTHTTAYDWVGTALVSVNVALIYIETGDTARAIEYLAAASEDLTTLKAEVGNRLRRIDVDPF